MKPIRIFLSSTFRDMHSERDYLVKYVFPELGERCAKRGLHLVPIDLRWGVTEEEAEKGNALEICLDEIENCRPYFIGILGERYGWVPYNYECPNIPKFDWLKDFETGHSITALEIYQGVLKNKDMKTRAFFYFRNPEFIKDVPSAKLPDIQSENEKSSDKLYHLKQNIKDTYDIHKLPGHYTDGYSCQYKGIRINWAQVKADLAATLSEDDYKAIEEVAGDDNLVDNDEYRQLTPEQKSIIDKYGVVYLDGLEEFGKDVLEDLWQAIDLENPESEIDTDPLLIERSQHEAFMHGRTRQFIGRDDILLSIEEYIYDKQSNKPLFVFGEPGTGKSALMAKAVLQYRAAHPESYTIARFVGISPDSTNIYKLVLNIVEGLASHFAFEIDRERLEKIDTTFDYFRETLYMLSSKGGKILIAIDALNQLHPSHDPQYLKWLPKVLPENVGIILSTLDGEYIAYAERFDMPIAKLGGLSELHCTEILRTKLGEYRKILTDEQLAEILKREDAIKPLYITVAAEILRVFPDFDLINARIKTLPNTIPQLFEQVLEGLEKDHSRQLVQDALCLIECSMHGLLESELLELLKRADEDILPANIWARLYRNISAYITGAGDNKEGLLNFFHQQFSFAVRRRYLTTEKTEKIYFQRLAEYGLAEFEKETVAVGNCLRYVGIYLYNIEDVKVLKSIVNRILLNPKHIVVCDELLRYVFLNYDAIDEKILNNTINELLNKKDFEYLSDYLTKTANKINEKGEAGWVYHLYSHCIKRFESTQRTEIQTYELATLYGYAGTIKCNLGEYEDAYLLFQKQSKLVSDLMKIDPKNIMYIREKAASDNNLSILLLNRGNIHDSLEFMVNSLSNINSDLIQKIQQKNNTLDFLPDVITAHFNLATVLYWSGNKKKALEFALEGKKMIATRLANNINKSDEDRYKSLLFYGLLTIGNIYEKIDFQKAKESHKMSHKLALELYCDYPHNMQRKIELVNACNNFGRVLSDESDNGESIKLFDFAIKEIESILTLEPELKDCKRIKANVLNNMALMHIQKGELQLADECHFQSIRLLESLTNEQNAYNYFYYKELENTFSTIAFILELLDRKHEATFFLVKSVMIAEKIINNNGNIIERNELADKLRKIIKLIDKNDIQGLILFHNTLIQNLCEILKLDNNNEIKWELANLYYSIARYFDLNNNNQTIICLLKAQIELEELIKVDSDNLKYKKHFCKVLSMMGVVEEKRGQLNRATNCLMQASDLLVEIIKKENTTEYFVSLSINENNIGTLYLKLQNRDNAIAHFDKALQIINACIKDNPDNINMKVMQASFHLNSSNAFIGANKLNYLNRAKEILESIIEERFIDAQVQNLWQKINVAIDNLKNNKQSNTP